MFNRASIVSLLLMLLLTTFLLPCASAGSEQEVTQNISSTPVRGEENALISRLLKGFAENAPRQLYDGVFVYLFEDKLQTIKVHRQVNDKGQLLEQFIPLDSEQKNSLRVLDNQFCALHNGWLYQFQAVSSSFPFRINNYFEQLQENYTFTLNKATTIAGIPVQSLLIKANDPYRYGYQLWLDQKTSTLLKYKLMDQKGNSIEQYLFTSIKFKDNSAVAASPLKRDKIISCEVQFQGLNTAYNQYFYSNKVPKGYQPVSFRKGFINNNEHLALQFQLSDGISSVSIFIEQINQDKNVNGVMKLGPVNVAGKSMGQYQVTVLGAVPVASALRFLRAVKVPE